MKLYLPVWSFFELFGSKLYDCERFDHEMPRNFYTIYLCVVFNRYWKWSNRVTRFRAANFDELHPGLYCETTVSPSPQETTNKMHIWHAFRQVISDKLWHFFVYGSLDDIMLLLDEREVHTRIYLFWRSRPMDRTQFCFSSQSATSSLTCAVT